MWGRQTDVRRRRQTAIVTHNFFFSLYHAEFSSKPHLALLLLGQEVLNRRSRDWLKTDTLSASHGGICIYHFITLIISVQPRDCYRLFLLVRPVQRISDWRLGQGSIFNIIYSELIRITSERGLRILFAFRYLFQNFKSEGITCFFFFFFFFYNFWNKMVTPKLKAQMTE